MAGLSMTEIFSYLCVILLWPILSAGSSLCCVSIFPFNFLQVYIIYIDNITWKTKPWLRSSHHLPRRLRETKLRQRRICGIHSKMKNTFWIQFYSIFGYTLPYLLHHTGIRFEFHRVTHPTVSGATGHLSSPELKR